MSKTLYISNGSRITLTTNDNLVSSPTLEVGTYDVCFDPNDRVFYLNRIQSLENHGKIYGNVNARVDKILNTFNDRETSTGVVLHGDKGSGKTLLVREVASKAIASGMPVLVVSSNYSGQAFNAFMGNIDQDVVVVFDEFEKVYDNSKEEQNALLTLFDGMSTSKKLYIITCNSVGRISPYMINRPGRVYYMFRYAGLDEKLVIEYCADKLNNQQYTDEVVMISGSSRTFSFDNLVALVSEVNRYGESPSEAIIDLNIDMTPPAGQYLITKLTGYDDTKFTKGDIPGETFRFNPARGFSLELYTEDGDEYGAGGLIQIHFKKNDLVSQTKDSLVYTSSGGVMVEFEYMRGHTSPGS